MIQIKKEEIKNIIIKTAKEIFLETSYRETSIRKISAKSNVSSSNIYNYFKNKDQIFTHILQPLLNKIELAKEGFIKFEIEEGRAHNLQDHKDLVKNVAQFIEKNQDCLIMLVFKSEGSSLENYVDNLIDWATDSFKQSFYKDLKDKVDPFLIHITASIWVNSLKEILMHDIKGERALKIAEDIMTFIFMGWQALRKECCDEKQKNGGYLI